MKINILDIGTIVIALISIIVGLLILPFAFSPINAQPQKPFTTYETPSACVYVRGSVADGGFVVIPKNQLFFRGKFDGC